MNEQRLQACLTLIEALVNCPRGEERALLQENRPLLDSDLLEVVEEVAAQVQADGRQKLAELLRELYSIIQTQIDALAADGEERQRAYLNLIEQLLTCPNGEEGEILAANAQLIDSDFLQACEAVGEIYAQQGDENAAEFLRQLAAQLGAAMGETQTLQAYKSFLQALLQAEYESGGDAQPVYAILRDNLDKLDEEFRGVLREWASATLNDADAEMREIRADLLENLCIDIQNFPLGRRSETVEIAIAGYELVLHSRENNREKWAQTQNNLGNGYSERIFGERGENLENAIACYRAALKVRTRTASPEKWAQTQNNLAVAYRNRIFGERAENLENAIACYRAALEVYTREAYPEKWATTQNNLAVSYYSRMLGERADNLENAIACYQEALEVRTRTAYPEDWAATQNNLGNAYRNRILGERVDNLENAIACYWAALEVRTRTAYPEDWAMTLHNLGNAYRDRILEKRAENLENAIACYWEALEVYTREAYPKKWAMTQNNLGLAYSNRILGERAENLENAIACYQEILGVYTRTAYPEDWAMTLHNLGNAYRDRILEKRAENLENAIACYWEALEVYTREAFPQNHAETLFNLGLACRDARKVSDARDAFAAAIETVESLGGESVSDEEAKQEIAQKWNKLYQNMVEVCREMGNEAEALKYSVFLGSIPFL